MKFVRHYRVRKWLVSLTAGVVSVACISQFHRLLNYYQQKPQLPSEISQSAVGGYPVLTPFSITPDESPLPAVNNSGSKIFPANVWALIVSGRFDDAKAELLKSAVAFVAAEDDIALATTLSQLGELALRQTRVDSAEVYLAEALDLFQQNGDEINAAGVYMQMGRLHLVARQRAREASDAYDSLLLARWKISHGQFYEAETELRAVVDRNLALNRFGAAASAYETLFKGYKKEQDLYQAQLAGLEAIRLHASSGRLFEARDLMLHMRDTGIDESVFPAIEREIDKLNQEFQRSVREIGLARDQAQLYHQLQARGDVVNAWRFRQRAGESMARASMRAQYQRQPDVLVELYRSNSSMEKAEDSLKRARAVYRRHGLDSQLQRSQQLQAQIY